MVVVGSGDFTVAAGRTVTVIRLRALFNCAGLRGPRSDYGARLMQNPPASPTSNSLSRRATCLASRYRCGAIIASLLALLASHGSLALARASVDHVWRSASLSAPTRAAE